MNRTIENLGSAATDSDAERMAELLRERGYDVRVGMGPGYGPDCGDIPQRVWEECLDIIALPQRRILRPTSERIHRLSAELDELRTD